MSIIDSLIIDRTSADVSYARQQTLKILRSGWDSLTESEQSEYLAGLKGAYNPSDLNRVTHAMEYLVERLRSYGYAVKYEKVKVPHQPQKGKSRLPAGYTELEYIESTGTQYIDTGFKPNNNTRVVLDFQMTGENSLAANDLFGARTSASSKAFAIQWNTSNDYFQHFYNNGYDNLDFGDFNIRQIAELNKNVMSLNGVTHTRTAATFQCDHSMYICAVNNAGTATFFSNMRVYSCQIYDNGTLVRDFVPCTNASGTVGLYDMVNGIFYANAGTGAFTAGAEVELPPVEILDDYTWYHSDIPQANELNAYLRNVKWLREAMVLYPNTPEVPDDMEGFTFAEANDIEQILVNIETIINLMVASFIYGGEIFSEEVI